MRGNQLKAVIHDPLSRQRLFFNETLHPPPPRPPPPHCPPLFGTLLDPYIPWSTDRDGSGRAQRYDVLHTEAIAKGPVGLWSGLTFLEIGINYHTMTDTTRRVC